MALKKDVVDTRKLKDEVAEFLKKQRWEKAADVLEQLVKAEPREMSHRLKLGDTYRRLDQVQRAIASFQVAAKAFADEGQLIKAIGAIKIVLEIDPKNNEAQNQLAEMNNRRFAKPTLESAGLRPQRVGAGARGASAMGLEDGQYADEAIAAALAAGADDEPLELDDGKPTPPRRGVAPAGGPILPQRGFHGGTTKPPPPARVPNEPEFELDAALAAASQRKPAVPAGREAPKPQGRDQRPLDLDPAMEKLPDDAILTPARTPEDLAVPPDDDEIALELSQEMPSMLSGKAASAPAKKQPVPAAAKPGAPAAKPAPLAEEIRFDEEPSSPSARAAAQPIADLLSGDSEEEIELLSISSDEEAAGGRPTEAPPRNPDEADLDAAFGAIAPAAAPKKRAPPKKVPLFDDLSQEAFVELVNKLSYHRHVPGQLIIREGDPGRSFFVIVEGKVRIYKQAGDKELTLAHLGEGAFFGEMALLSGAPRTANVVAQEETELLEVTDLVLRDLAAKHPQVIQSLKNFYRQRLLNNVMAISPLFRDFDPGERKAIVEKFKLRQAAAGDVLISEGKNSDGLYVVMHGAVNVAAKKGDKPVGLARLKEGEIFGEMSLLTRKPATATVTAHVNAILLKLPRESFQELVLTHPQILELVSELTEQRKSATEAILSGQGPGHDGMSFV